MNKPRFNQAIATTTTAAFLLAVLALPIQAFAVSTGGTAPSGESTPSASGGEQQTITGPGTNVKIKLASEAACVQQLQEYKLKDIKAYGEKRSVNRLATIKKLEAIVDNVFKQPSSTAKKLDKVVAESENQGVSTGGTKPVDSEQKVRHELNQAKNTVTSNRDALKATNERKDAAIHACNIIFDARVYSYLYNKVIIYKRLDRAFNLNQTSLQEYKTIKQLVDNKKLSKRYLKNIKAPTDRSKDIAALQVVTDGYKSKTFKSAEIRATRAEARKLLDEVKSEYKPINKRYLTAMKFLEKKKDTNGNGGTKPTNGSD